MTARPGTIATALLLILLAGSAAARDSDQRRFYAGVRFETLPGSITGANDVAGGSFGVNFNRYFGAELALDSYEVKVGNVAELSVIGLTPQLRLRYPLLDDRLTPYLVAGAGLAVTQGNDARAPVTWSGGKDGVQPTGTVGGGVEYFLADNITIGLEAKQLFSGQQQYQTGGRQGAVAVGRPLLTVGVRLYYPQLDPEQAARDAAAATARFYLDLRTGGALLVDSEPFEGVRATPEQGVFGSNFSQAFGVSVGANLGRYASVELALDNYELSLSTSDLGGIGEYAVFPILVQGRLRYPLWKDRLQPFLVGGAGGEYAQINDRTEVGKSIAVTARDLTVIGALGAGVEYYVMNNAALGMQARYVISRGHTFQIENEPERSGTFDSFFLTVGLRIVFANV